jgi:hypothetical protein
MLSTCGQELQENGTITGVWGGANKNVEHSFEAVPVALRRVGCCNTLIGLRVHVLPRRMSILSTGIVYRVTWLVFRRVCCFRLQDRSTLNMESGSYERCYFWEIALCSLYVN